jgi:hypothetical protein
MSEEKDRRVSSPQALEIGVGRRGEREKEKLLELWGLGIGR